MVCFIKTLIFFFTIFEYGRSQLLDSLSSTTNSLIFSQKTKKTKTKSNKINIKFKYHNYEELTNVMKTIAKRHPNITRLYSIGKSVENRELWAMQITENIQKEMPLKPNVKYVANMHGNEAVGREMLVHLIAHLVNFNKKSSNVQTLLKHTNIHILPSMNPDGYEKAIEKSCDMGPGRNNANNFDLNRNFPDRVSNNSQPEQPETKAIRKWLDQTHFVLSANLHGGELVVNYPFDSSAEEDSVHLERTPDHDVFVHLALVYAKKHSRLKSGVSCRSEDSFHNGITNGNAWYSVQGSMQDYNYVQAGCMELTLELSCCKYPHSSNLLKYWNENKTPLLMLLMEAHKGVKGFILDYYSEKAIPKANLTVLGRESQFQSDINGQFWRILLPGDYVLIIKAKGYKTLQKQFTVNEHKITIINVYLAPVRQLIKNDIKPESLPLIKLKNSVFLNQTKFTTFLIFLSLLSSLTQSL